MLAPEVTMSARFQFDPDQVAYCEVAGWKAYYDHDWLKLLRLIVGLCQSQFRIPFPVSVLAACYTVRASVVWVPKVHDPGRIRWNLDRFYRIARRYSGLAFAPARAGALELAYWDIHRRLSGQPDKSEFVQIMTDLHAELFSLTPEQARESAERRVEANNILDTITSKQSADPAADWTRCEESLRQCYRSIQRQLAS
jgi:hypothetical protein